MKPILFNTDMVQAILEGRKTVTRRVVNGVPAAADKLLFRCGEYVPWVLNAGMQIGDAIKPPYKTGDILYVRETWRLNNPAGDFKYNNRIADLTYRADLHTEIIKITQEMEKYLSNKWRPSIHMPKEAARIFLRVTNVRVERLQEITDEQVTAEGANWSEWFADVWDSTIKPADRDKYGWAADPWVWVLEFKRISREDAMK